MIKYMITDSFTCHLYHLKIMVSDQITLFQASRDHIEYPGFTQGYSDQNNLQRDISLMTFIYVYNGGLNF